MNRIIFIILALSISFGAYAETKPVKKSVSKEKIIKTVAPVEDIKTSVITIVTPTVFVLPSLNYSIPAGDIAPLLTGSVGIEVEVQLRNFFSSSFIIGIAGSYNGYGGIVNTSDSLYIIQLKLLPKYVLTSFNTSSIYVNGGMGFAFEGLTVSSVNVGNTDLLWQIGLGYELKLNNNVFNAELNYIIVPEKSLSTATKDGAFIEFKIGMAFDLTSK